MPQRSSKKKEPRDINELAFNIVKDLTSEESREEEEEQKNPHAVALGRLGEESGSFAKGISVAKYCFMRAKRRFCAATPSWEHDFQAMG
jgi:hypothetical protein